MVARYGTQAEEFDWLRRQARENWDYITRTAAVLGLARAHQLDDKVIRYLIDPAFSRRDGRRRDTDRGVCGSVAAAIVQDWGSSAMPPLQHRQLAVDLLADPADSHRDIIRAALAPLDALPLDRAVKVLDEMKFLTPADADERFLHLLARLETSLQYRQEQHRAAQRLQENPAEMLRAFQQQAQPKLMLTPPIKLETNMIDCALISVTDTESKALMAVLRNHPDVQLTDMPESRHNRSFWPFSLQPKKGRALSCIQIQPSDKGPHSAQALINDLLRDFQPRLIVIVGVCGGFPERGVKLYDVIMAFQVHNYERERLMESGNQSQAQSYRFSAEPLGLVRSLNSGGLLNDALDGGELHIKDYAAGEKVIADVEAPLRQRILKISGDIYGVEMEGQGILHAAWENARRSSVQTALIKGVSDCCDGDMREDKDTKQNKAATRAARVALTLIAHFQMGE